MDYTIVGKIINTHGIKGEVKVFPLTNNINRFDFLKIAYIGEEKIRVQIEKVKYHKNFVILKFNGFNDINEILSFKDNYIFVDEEGLVKLPENHFFIYDLVGSQVIDIESNIVGTIKDVIQGASNDVYVIKNIEGNKEYLIPAVKQFIIDVNIVDKKIIINPIEGMIE
ncbi:ribosome maturation factor RimM [Tissierella sp.]|uniref:ribosome maturation factor RimM n=1 Tax=Tissierella sp. TaxID=41274 RepID=UPI002865C5E4|nr:ribosome maturation factor RimM [Tissierella sp.]MDR7856357.1 ribosome maturation factor RimM [Tissierella sp.]